MSTNGDARRPRFEVILRGRRLQKELDRVREPESHRILEALRSLASNPRPSGCKKLDARTYRVRVGDWRIIYRVDEAASRVYVGAIARRSERTYRNVDDLFR